MKQYLLPICISLLLCVGGVWWWGRVGARTTTPENPAPPTNSESIEFAGLPEAKQKEIWDAEHVTFEIETHFGKKWVERLKQRSADHLADFYRSGFSGLVPKRDTPMITVKSPITETAYSIDDNGSLDVDADGFSRRLIASIDEIPADATGRFRVLQIKRADNESPELWKLQVLLTLGGTRSDGKPIAYVSHGSMRCRFSNDDEIVAGRIVESWNIESESVRSGQQTLLEEVTAAVGLDSLAVKDNWNLPREEVRQYRFQTAVEDFDSDGFLDIAVATLDRQRFLLRWDALAGRYQDVTEQMGVSNSIQTDNRAYLSCTIDFDNDGDADLILGDSLLENIDGKTFRPVADNGGLRFGFNPMGCVVADYDGDGRLDLYVTYQRDEVEPERDRPPGWVGDDDSGAFNELWRNRGDGTFIEKGHSSGAAAGKRHSFAATWLYANDDHYPDLYVANDFARNSLLINQGDGSFEDVADNSGVGDFATSMGVASGDINGDGTPEIYVANMYSKMGRRIIGQVTADDYPDGIFDQLVGSCAGNRLYSTSGDVRDFHELSEQLGINAVGWAYAPAFADFDADGTLDLYASTGFLSFSRHKPDG